ncbi:hypothetical protein [Asticcacaulis sp. EMRT-3]|uniref:hypothetical protein n=1 Tax=Asticcacaulis sp. EMRT-3 TaxID=3040349 RepID=UPI0024AF7AD2|nr:hypothetical protein [Asticcacaulis sp. EMRT-3]MDI7775646.1 hypothetical protein [Asticcacaulis sp. EMRT-3]
MQAQIIPFPQIISGPKHAPRGEAPIRQVSIDGEYFEDDLPPVLFDAEEEREDLAYELGVYVQMADHWND